MKKYLDYFTLIPIGIVTMLFMTDTDLCLHCKNTCLFLLSYLLIFCFLYIILLYMKMNKWMVVSIAIVLWILLISLKKKYM